MGCCGSKGSRGEREPLLHEQRKAPEKKPSIQETEAREKIERKTSFHETDAGQGIIQAGKMTGQALLQLAGQVPILAPVAFLVGAAASSAQEAVVLRADCREFGRMLNSLEVILLKAENLSNHSESVAEVREALQDSLQVLEAMKNHKAFKAFWVVDSQKSKFEDLRSRIKVAIDRLQFQSTIDTNAMLSAQFNQSAQLQQKLQTLGGPEAVERNPELARELVDDMSASDQVLATMAIDSSRTLKIVEERQKLEIEQSRMEADLQRMRNEVLQQQVKELKAMVAEVRDAMRLFPVPAREPERMVVMEHGGFLNLSPGDSAFATLQRVTQQGAQKWKIFCMVNMIGRTKQYTAAGYMPEVEGGVGGEGKVEGADFCGMVTPRKMSTCQHVVASEKPVVYTGQPPFPLPDGNALAVARTVDPTLAKFLGEMEESRNPIDHARGHGKERAMEVAAAYLGECQSNPDTMFYAGVPLELDGVVVGSFCLMGPRPPALPFGDEDLEAMKVMAAEITKALEQQLRDNRARWDSQQPSLANEKDK